MGMHLLFVLLLLCHFTGLTDAAYGSGQSKESLRLLLSHQSNVKPAAGTPLCNMAYVGGFNISIEGDSGSGKTAVMNLVGRKILNAQFLPNGYVLLSP